MGKALVIEGLTVSNPLCTVTFDITVQSLTIDKNSLSLTVGDTSSLTATVVTSDGSAVTPTFESSNSSIASVSASGNTATITAVAKGNATITVRAGSKSVTCSVAVAASAAGDLATYYAANATITQADKTALNTLVTGIGNAGIWTKVKRFYPLLGTTLHDLFLEVKEDSTKGFTDSSTFITNNFTAQTNMVKSATTSSGSLNGASASTDPASISTNNLSIASLCTLSDSYSKAGKIYAAFLEGSGAFEHNASNSSASRGINVVLGSTTATYVDPNSLLDRSIIVSVNETSVVFYYNGVKASTVSIENSTAKLMKLPYTIFGGSDTTYKFLLITEELTESEALALSGLLDTFYAATGKRSAS